MKTEFAELALRQGAVRVEIQWINADDVDAPLMIFLHEGLGSIAMWRDFPQRLCDAGKLRGLIYSRPGYGKSTPRKSDEKWTPDYLQHEADTVLPALLRALKVTQPYWLFGHSDGASIVLLHAASHPSRTFGAIVLAPHVFVEQMSLDGIVKTVENYRNGALKANLARYHDEPDSPFYGWSDAWLSPAFRDWNIEAQVARISRPLLVIQGEGDEYGTMEQLDRIEAALPGCTLLKLPDCGHIPHRDKPDEVIVAAVALIRDKA